MSKSWGEIREEALRRCGQLPPKTNADRIRAMTDEELAEFISNKARTFGEEFEGYMSALDWLREEGE